MYPSHEAQTRPQSPSTVDTPPGHRDRASGITAQSICEALKISRVTYDMLMASYFTNMTSFSLFRPGSIEPKFAMMQHPSEAEALIAAMFSFSARHCQPSGCPSPSYFACIASLQLDESVGRYGDMLPPFWLLQACVLVTFYQLTQSVRSRSWKKLGDCIRYAYDMNLHIVDANHEPASTTNGARIDMQRWVLLEERRRAWWAIWEMDVFASTIRRLPTAIDGSQNLTMLPVPDSCWFNDVYQESCFLAVDCSLRWKHLVRSGNRSAKAWFIVVNSLMRNTQRIVYPAGSAMQSLNDKHADTNHEELEIMANTLYCTVTSLPASLAYHGETLDFGPQPSPRDRVSPRQEHADKYALHLMTQLCRFMIYHHKICARAPWLAQQHPDPPAAADGNCAAPTAQQANSEWSNYMNASDEIVTVVRNSSRDHCRYVNPFLVNTLWFAAAAQCACNVFGPSSFNKRLRSSNLDLLKLTIDRYISFWGGMENLRGKLARIETGLQNLMARPNGNGSGSGNGSGNGNGNGNGNRSRNEAGDVPEQRERQHPAQGSASICESAQRCVGTQVLACGEAALQENTAMPGTESLMATPGVIAPNGWADPRWPALVPDLGDLTQPFAVTGQSLYATDPMDFSPFGLEELLMHVASVDSHI
ncbi:hypothetical protein MMYC01_206283 [Madurella mycetomatis]|uniref:Xylanolytic transcriptional activator regulatory domain-containing protein n=1 Tax=Madurella mycetomatis TaxID=100816 RepID=A0A175W5J8_9PEZI|nr:hypothetical protein MMYC01_206283 [Madurella mycetomatis]